MLSTMTADHLQIKNGTLSLSTARANPSPPVYQQLNAEVTNLSPTASSPSSSARRFPVEAPLNADGTAGPINYDDADSTPLNTHATLNHIDLASSGLVAPETGIAGLANVDLRGCLRRQDSECKYLGQRPESAIGSQRLSLRPTGQCSGNASFRTCRL